MSAHQTSVGASSGELLAPTEHHIDTLDKPANYDPDVIGAYGLEPDWARCDECGDRFQDVGDDRRVCDDCDATEPDDEPHYYVCPTCGGNGCGPCRGTGERLDITHPIGQDR